MAEKVTDASMTDKVTDATSVWDQRYEGGEHVGSQPNVDGDPIDYTQHKFLYRHAIAEPTTGLAGWLDHRCGRRSGISRRRRRGCCRSAAGWRSSKSTWPSRGLRAAHRGLRDVALGDCGGEGAGGGAAVCGRGSSCGRATC